MNKGQFRELMGFPLVVNYWEIGNTILSGGCILALVCLLESEMCDDYNRMMGQIGNKIDSIKSQKTQNITRKV